MRREAGAWKDRSRRLAGEAQEGRDPPWPGGSGGCPDVTQTLTEDDACPLLPMGQDQGWSPKKGPWHHSLLPRVDTVCLLTHESIACLVLFGHGGRGDERGLGSPLYSESPVIFPLIIWKSVKERSLSGSKCLTHNQNRKKCQFQASPTSVSLLALTPSLPPSSPTISPFLML